MVFKANTKLHEWQKRASEGGSCAMCGKMTSYLTVDHIIPLFLFDAFDMTGHLKTDWENNFQLLCMPCNRFKASRIDPRNPKNKELLQFIIEQI